MQHIFVEIHCTCQWNYQRQIDDIQNDPNFDSVYISVDGFSGSVN